MISLTIGIMKDQTQWLYQRDIFAIFLILIIMANNPHIWRCVDKRDYSIVFGMPEMLSGNRSSFWLQTIQNRINKFCQ